MLGLRRRTIPERGVARATGSIRILHPLNNFSGMAKDRIVKFCARVGPRSISRLMTNCPSTSSRGIGQGHVTS